MNRMLIQKIYLKPSFPIVDCQERCTKDRMEYHAEDLIRIGRREKYTRQDKKVI